MRLNKWTASILFGLLLVCSMAIIRAEEKPKPVPLDEEQPHEDKIHNGPPVDAEVYFSKDDPNWPDAQKAIAEAVKAFPRMRVKEISIDTKEGYAALKEAEKTSNIKTPGDITFIMGPFKLIDKGASKKIALYLQPLALRLFDPTNGKGRLLAGTDAFAKKEFGAEITLEPQPVKPADEFHFHQVMKDKARIGWVVDAYRPTNCPVCNDNQFLIAVDATDLHVRNLEPVRELEKYGVAMSAEESKTYTDKFKNLKYEGKKFEVEGVSGATKTGYYYQDMVTEILAELKNRSTQK